MAGEFIETKQYQRFKEFCDECRKYKYIGLCYGVPGVGKTLSASHYAKWDNIMAYNKYNIDKAGSVKLNDVLGQSVVFYTVPSGNSPRDGGISDLRERLRSILREGIEREKELHIAEVKKQDLSRQQEEMRRGDRWKMDGRDDDDLVRMIDKLHIDYGEKWRKAKDPTDLLVIDEADRLKMAGLEHARDIFDRGGIGLVLIGMPGLEKQLARYPQLYSRIGFVHEFKQLSRAEIHQLLAENWWPSHAPIPRDGIADEESIALIIRITGGNFRLLHRLLTQIGRVMQINKTDRLTAPVVEAAREGLVIGAA